MGERIEPIDLGENVTPDDVMRCIREAIDFAYRTVPPDKYANARVNVSAVMVDWLWQQVAAARRPMRAPPANKAPRHHYKPHPQYPWFCDQCGYPEHEALLHEQPARSPAP